MFRKIWPVLRRIFTYWASWGLKQDYLGGNIWCAVLSEGFPRVFSSGVRLESKHSYVHLLIQSYNPSSTSHLHLTIELPELAAFKGSHQSTVSGEQTASESKALGRAKNTRDESSNGKCTKELLDRRFTCGKKNDKKSETDGLVNLRRNSAQRVQQLTSWRESKWSSDLRGNFSSPTRFKMRSRHEIIRRESSFSPPPAVEFLSLPDVVFPWPEAGGLSGLSKI